MLDNRPILVGSILLLVVPTHLQLVEDTLRRAVSQPLVAFLVQCHPILELLDMAHQVKPRDMELLPVPQAMAHSKVFLATAGLVLGLLLVGMEPQQLEDMGHRQQEDMGHRQREDMGHQRLEAMEHLLVAHLLVAHQAMEDTNSLLLRLMEVEDQVKHQGDTHQDQHQDSSPPLLLLR